MPSAQQRRSNLVPDADHFAELAQFDRGPRFALVTDDVNVHVPDGLQVASLKADDGIVWPVPIRIPAENDDCRLA